MCEDAGVEAGRDRRAGRRERGILKRTAATALTVVVALTACSAGPPVPSSPPLPNPGSPMEEPSTPISVPSTGQEPGEPAPPSGVGTTMAALPSDIVTAVDRLLDAGSDAERMEAAAAALAIVGITVSSAEVAAPETHAGIVLSPEEVEVMAREAADRDLYRATLADFAETFGGMALLAPNDALADGLPVDWLDAVEPEADVEDGPPLALDLSTLPSRMATVVNGWVASAIEQHDSTDPDLVELTNAPLLLAELARRRPQPLDLAQAFSAADLRLGGLEITILTAGLRSMLVGAEAAGITAAPVAQGGSTFLAVHRDDPVQTSDPFAAPTPCDTVKQMLDSRVPLASTVIKGFVGNQIKGFIQNFVNALFGEATAFAQSVGPAFKVLSIMFRVQALIMLYSESTARVEMDPTSYHKPDGSPMTVAATVTAGISDAAWESAQQARQLSPFATALRTCARFLGLPVWQDLVDAGDAMSGWSVGWTIDQGSGHVRFNAREEFWGHGAVPGRQEKPLSRVNDHTANDILGYEVLAERRGDHPGTEMEEPVELCAHVYPKAPPNGFGTILSAGTAGASLAGGAYLGLVSVVASLLTGWVSTVAAIKGCGLATVSYHVATPGAFRGTVTVNTEVQQSFSSTVSQYVGPNRGTTVTTRSSRISIDVTDRFYFGGSEEEAGLGYVSLGGRAYTQGAAVDEFTGTTTNAWSGGGCSYDATEIGTSGGGWSFDLEASGIITLFADGRYTIGWYGDLSDEDVILPGELVTDINLRPGDNCEDVGSGTEERAYFPSPSTASLGHSSVEGKLDPTDPGNVLAGSVSITNADLSTTTITWNIVHEGPIRLPTR